MRLVNYIYVLSSSVEGSGKRRSSEVQVHADANNACPLTRQPPVRDSQHARHSQLFVLYHSHRKTITRLEELKESILMTGLNSKSEIW